MLRKPLDRGRERESEFAKPHVCWVRFASPHRDGLGSAPKDIELRHVAEVEAEDDPDHVAVDHAHHHSRADEGESLGLSIEVAVSQLCSVGTNMPENRSIPESSLSLTRLQVHCQSGAR